MSFFNRKDLKLENKINSFWSDNGYLVFNDFYTDDECDELISRADFLIKNYDFKNHIFKSVFDTNEQKHAEDEYFLNSGDKISFFF